MAKIDIFKGDITRNLPLGDTILSKGDVVRIIGISKAETLVTPAILPGILNIDTITIPSMTSFNGVAVASISNINGIS